MTDIDTQTRITLKKLKVAEFASEETLCFSALVLLDGKPIARAKNDGRGGCTFIDPLPGKTKALTEGEAYAKTLPSVTSSYSKAKGSKTFTIAVDLEFLVVHLANEMHLKAAFKRDFRNKVMFVKDGKLNYLQGVRLPKVADKARLFVELRKKHGAQIVVSELTETQAFVLWRKHS